MDDINDILENEPKDDG